jgi:hypothetical protein
VVDAALETRGDTSNPHRFAVGSMIVTVTNCVAPGVYVFPPAKLSFTLPPLEFKVVPWHWMHVPSPGAPLNPGSAPVTYANATSPDPRKATDKTVPKSILLMTPIDAYLFRAMWKRFVNLLQKTI